MHMRKIIITVAAGDVWRKFADEHMIPGMRRYAAKVDADFIVWSKRPIDVKRHIYYAWWDALAWVLPQGYHKILVLDSDIMIKEDAGNIFDVPFDGIAMSHMPYWAERMNACHELLGPDMGPQDIYNAGVVLLENKFARELLKMTETLDPKLFDAKSPLIYEWVICYLLKNTPITDLGMRWNCNVGTPEAITPEAEFVHVSGYPRREYVPKKDSMLDQLHRKKMLLEEYEMRKRAKVQSGLLL